MDTSQLNTWMPLRHFYLSESILELTFIEPWPHPFTTKLDLPDLAEGGEDLLEVLPVHVPGQAPDVDLSGGRGPAPSPAPGPRLGPRALAGLLWRRLEIIIVACYSKYYDPTHLDTWLVILGFAFLPHWRGRWLLPCLWCLSLVLTAFLLLIFLCLVPASGSDKESMYT